MKKSDYIIKSLVSAAGVFVYVAAVAWLGFNIQSVFGKQPSFLAPLFMLLLFVVSAAITGLLVFGKPIYLYFNGRKKEAITLLFATLTWLLVFLVGVAVVLMLQ